MFVQTTCAASTFGAMKTVLQANKDLLTAYEDDFYSCDKHYLERTWHEGAQYCWFVRSTGTHLALLGVHHQLSDVEQTEAAICASQSPTTAIFHIHNGKVAAIDKQQALRMLATDGASYGEGKISYKHRALASYRVDSHYLQSAGVNIYDVHLDSQGIVHSITEMVVLHEMSRMIARVHARSICLHMDKITLDGEHLSHVMAHKRKS